MLPPAPPVSNDGPRDSLQPFQQALRRGAGRGPFRGAGRQPGQPRPCGRQALADDNFPPRQHAQADRQPPEQSRDVLVPLQRPGRPRPGPSVQPTPVPRHEIVAAVSPHGWRPGALGRGGRGRGPPPPPLTAGSGHGVAVDDSGALDITLHAYRRRAAPWPAAPAAPSRSRPPRPRQRSKAPAVHRPRRWTPGCRWRSGACGGSTVVAPSRGAAGRPPPRSATAGWPAAATARRRPRPAGRPGALSPPACRPRQTAPPDGPGSPAPGRWRARTREQRPAVRAPRPSPPAGPGAPGPPAGPCPAAGRDEAPGCARPGTGRLRSRSTGHWPRGSPGARRPAAGPRRAAAAGARRRHMPPSAHRPARPPSPPPAGWAPTSPSWMNAAFCSCPRVGTPGPPPDIHRLSLRATHMTGSPPWLPSRYPRSAST